MYRFKQAVHFPGKKMGKDEKGLELPDGPSHSFKNDDLCDVPEAVEEHPYFLKLVECGLVKEEEAPKQAPQESPDEAAKRLHSKLMSKKPQEKQEEEPKKGKGKKHKE